MKHYTEDLEAHVDYLHDIMYSIQPGEISVLTGSNGSGKSLIRKQLIFAFSEKDGKNPKEDKNYRPIASVSMEARTSSNPSWGALSSCLQDTEWIATSNNTFHLIKSLFSHKDKNKYLVIDEPEIGMGEEMVIALVDWFNERIAEGDFRGMLFITHNRYIIEHLNYTNFFNCDGIKSKEEWLKRPLEKADLNILDENKLFFYLRDLNKNS